MKKLAFAVLLFIAFVPPLTAQNIGKTTQKMIQRSGVFIGNTSTRYQLNFSISGDKCAPPLETSLAPDSFNTFTCPEAESFAFSIRTKMPDGKIQERRATLYPTRRYELFSNKGIWDIREVTSR